MVDEKDIARGAFINCLNQVSHIKHNKEARNNKRKNNILNTHS